MSNVKLTKSNSKFKPFNVTIEFDVETVEDLESINNEFINGIFENGITTEYSLIIYDILKELQEL